MILKCFRKKMRHFSRTVLSGKVLIYRIIIKLAGIQDSHKISDKFDFRPDQTICFGVTCPWAPKIFPIDLYWRKCCGYNSISVLIVLSSNLQVTRTAIESSIDFSDTYPWGTEKKCCGHDSAFSFHQIFKLADNEDGIKSCRSLILGQIAFDCWKIFP